MAGSGSGQGPTELVDLREGDLTRLLIARTNELEELTRRLAQEVEERSQAEANARRLAITDELTGLFNRRGLQLLAGQQMLIAPRTAQHVMVVFLDLDDLKQINDSRGHQAGDAVLRAAAEGLRNSFRAGDIVARTGGDEFVVFATGPADLVDTLVTRLRSRLLHDGHPIEASIGVATRPAHHGGSLDELLGEADAAMYRDKRDRRLARSRTA